MSREFSITFDMGNAAFDDGNAPAECARILRDIAAKVERGQEDGTVRDVNGNNVGAWSAEYPEPEDEEEDEG